VCVCVCVCTCIRKCVVFICLCVFSRNKPHYQPCERYSTKMDFLGSGWPLCASHAQLHQLPQSNNWSVFSLLLPNAEVIFRAMWRQWNKDRRPVWTQLAVSRTITINNADRAGSSRETYGNRLIGDRITELSNCSLTFIFRQLLSH
jgi:hypothetical protein